MPGRAVFVLVFMAAIGCGVVSGMLYVFSTGVMTGLGRLPLEQGSAAMNAINVAVINPAFLGMFLGTALLCLFLAVGSFMFAQHLVHPRLVLVASLIYLLGAFGVTMAFNVPLNDQLAAAEPSGMDALWAEYLRVWTGWNHVRTCASMLAAVVFTMALLSE